jgi:hypothetical protein
MKLKTYDDKIRVSEKAKKDKASKSFILSVRYLVPIDQEDKEDLKRLGFDSLSEFIQCSTGLVLDAETFVKLAFAYWVYRHKACDVINYLVTQEGWTELLSFVPPEHQVDCGARLNDNGGDRKTNQIDNVKLNEKGGNSASYTLKRLARDAAKDEKVAELYKQVKEKRISPNKAAIDLGWRLPTVTVKKDVESASRTLRRFFNDGEIRELISYLK